MNTSGDPQLPLDARLHVRYLEFQPRLSGSLDAFSETLREIYDEQVPQSMRHVRLSCQPNVVARMTANGKRLQRYFDAREQYHFPLALMPAFVEAAYRLDVGAGTAMRTDICRAVKSLYVPEPDAAQGADLARMGRMASTFGESMQALAPIVEDGRVDRKDLPYVDRAMRDIDELMGAAAAVKYQLQQLRDSASAGAVVHAEQLKT